MKSQGREDLATIGQLDLPTRYHFYQEHVNLDASFLSLVTHGIHSLLRLDPGVKCIYRLRIGAVIVILLRRKNNFNRLGRNTMLHAI